MNKSALNRFFTRRNLPLLRARWRPVSAVWPFRAKALTAAGLFVLVTCVMTLHSQTDGASCANETEYSHRPLSTPMHEWPPGVVDRALQADVWPDRIELEVSLGLSDETVQTALKKRLTDESGMATTPEERTAQLRERVLAELCRVIELRIDDKPVAWKPVRSELSSKHHVLFFCYLEAPCEITDSPVEIVIRDQSFPEFQNQLRLALRPRRTKRLSANVAPLVIRTERIMLDELPDEEVENARRMRGLFSPVNYVPPSRIAEANELKTSPRTTNGESEAAGVGTTDENASNRIDGKDNSQQSRSSKEDVDPGADPAGDDGGSTSLNDVPTDFNEGGERSTYEADAEDPQPSDPVTSTVDAASSNFSWGQLIVIGVAVLFLVAGIWVWLRQNHSR